MFNFVKLKCKDMKTYTGAFSIVLVLAEYAEFCGLLFGHDNFAVLNIGKCFV